MSAYTTTDLIKSVRVRGMFPDASAGTLSADNILLIASEELRLSIVPMILAVREKYYETYVDYDLESGRGLYPIPDRAVGGIASCVQYILNQSVSNLPPLDPNQVATTVTGSYPKGFYFENDHVVMYPTPNSSSGTVRIRYFKRPSLLEQTINCAQITAVDDTASTVTVRSMPSSWSSAMAYDFISNTVPYTPYGIDTIADGIDLTNLVMTFTTSGLPRDTDDRLMPKVGDWVALAGYTPLPEVMSEFFPLLAQATAVKLLEAIGDKENMTIAAAKLKAYADGAIRLITPRDQFGLKKVKSDWRNW